MTYRRQAEAADEKVYALEQQLAEEKAENERLREALVKVRERHSCRTSLPCSGCIAENALKGGG